MGTPGPILVFADCQKIVMLQTPSDQNSASQIAEPDFPYIGLYKNNCHISLSL